MLALLELAHQAAQERVQLLLLVVAQRRGDQRLVLGAGPERLLPDLVARVRQLDEGAAPVVRVGPAPAEPRRFEPVDAVRHRAARELGPRGQLPDRAAVWRLRLTELVQRLSLLPPEPLIWRPF